MGSVCRLLRMPSVLCAIWVLYKIFPWRNWVRTPVGGCECESGVWVMCCRHSIRWRLRMGSLPFIPHEVLVWARVGVELEVHQDATSVGSSYSSLFELCQLIFEGCLFKVCVCVWMCLRLPCANTCVCYAYESEIPWC